ncbi:hypothetical protein V8E53_008730 [Lactarius tabidus]
MAAPSALAIPHAASEDGFYEGFFIPKLFIRASASVRLIDLLLMAGALVAGNTWSVSPSQFFMTRTSIPSLMSSNLFPNADSSFRDDPLLSSAFGYGKHIAQGGTSSIAVSFCPVFALGLPHREGAR